ncbi:MAG: beta-lactamase family protein [Bacteroidetes bacterium]|nr:MAG: beta-lactamase family protein [Bacteroidota bacterium]
MSQKILLDCLKSTVIATFLLILQPLNAQNKWVDLDDILQQKQQLLGKDLVMMVANKDTIVYKKELGDFKSKTPAPIASASKWFTAALVMILVDEGKISLDDNIVNYIPEFGKYFKKYITVRHCLSHMTGIKEEGGVIKNLFQRKKYESLEEEVNAIASREIQAAPGTEFRYSGYGLNIAGRICEIVTKKKFDQLIKLKLFGPLTMRSSNFTEANMGPINPSGGAKSTAEDYMKFLTMLLNRGNYKGKQIISEASIDEMMKINTKAEQIKYAPKSATGFNYASGSWVIEEKDNKATALASPGLFGTWPMIDFCRGYAYLVVVKNFLGEERADAHLQIKEVVDEQFKKNDCSKE